MKKKTMSIAIALMTCLLLSAGTYAREPGDRGPMKDARGFCGCHPMRGLERLLDNDERLAKLSVADAQKAALQDISLRFEQDSIGLEADMKMAMLSMKKLMKSDSSDREAIFKAMEDINTAELKWKKAEMAAWLDARHVFTADQQAALKKVLCGMHGKRGDDKEHDGDRRGSGCRKGGCSEQSGCPMMKVSADNEIMKTAE